MSTTRMRQFVVTDRATGIVTLVNAKEWLCKTGQYKGGHAAAATQLGMRAYVDCDIRAVPRGNEMPLPFDCIPLQIGRRARKPPCDERYHSLGRDWFCMKPMDHDGSHDSVRQEL